MAESSHNPTHDLTKPVAHQTVVSSLWIPITPHQHNSSPAYERLNTPVTQIYTVKTNRTPYDNVYSKDVITVNTQSIVDQSVPICYKCKSAIDSSFRSKITFNNHLYHPVCFNCAICRKNISSSDKTNFSINDDGEPLCAHCELKNAKICAACGNHIVTGGSILFETMNYHTDCFRCIQCRRLLAGEQKTLNEHEKPCCISCYKDHFAPRCFKCLHPIVLERTITFDGKKYHADCFLCGQCNKVVTDPEYYTHLGKPCCIKCFNERIALRCAECFRVIANETYINCEGKHYHSECLRCGQCQRRLVNEKDLFKHNEKPCCSQCHDEKFAPKCVKCSRPIKEKVFSTFQNQSFHSDCFTCLKCRRVIRSSDKFYNEKFGAVCLTCGK